MLKSLFVLLAVLLSSASCTAPFKMARPSPESKAVLEPTGVETALILTADDFGRNHATNLGVIEGIEQGLVSSVALMPVGSAVEEAYDYISKHPELDVGVHLVLARDNIEPKWKPILSPEEIPTLVESDSTFSTSIWWVYWYADDEDIEKELDAQIQAVLSRGIDPTSLSFHKGFFQMHDPKTFSIVIKLAKKYNLPVRRQAILHDRGIRKAGILSTDKVVYDIGTYSNRRKRKKFLSSMDWLPRGITEFVLHLAVEGEDEKDVRSRAAELKIITDPSIKDYIKKKGIKLIGFKPLRDLQRTLSMKDEKKLDAGQPQKEPQHEME